MLFKKNMALLGIVLGATIISETKASWTRELFAQVPGTPAANFKSAITSLPITDVRQALEANSLSETQALAHVSTAIGPNPSNLSVLELINREKSRLSNDSNLTAAISTISSGLTISSSSQLQSSVGINFNDLNGLLSDINISLLGAGKSNVVENFSEIEKLLISNASSSTTSIFQLLQNLIGNRIRATSLGQVAATIITSTAAVDLQTNLYAVYVYLDPNNVDGTTYGSFNATNFQLSDAARNFCDALTHHKESSMGKALAVLIGDETGDLPAGIINNNQVTVPLTTTPQITFTISLHDTKQANNKTMLTNILTTRTNLTIVQNSSDVRCVEIIRRYNGGNYDPTLPITSNHLVFVTGFLKINS